MSWKNVIKIIILAASAGLRAFAGMADIADGGSEVRKVLNLVNFVRGCEPRDDANRDHLDEPLREEIARNTKYGFRNTILLQYDALLRDDLVALAKTAQRDRTEYGCSSTTSCAAACRSQRCLRKRRNEIPPLIRVFYGYS